MLLVVVALLLHVAVLSLLLAFQLGNVQRGVVGGESGRGMGNSSRSQSDSSDSLGPAPTSMRIREWVRNVPSDTAMQFSTLFQEELACEVWYIVSGRISM